MLCLISGVAGQAGSPETVWGTEDLYGELHSRPQPHGCLQRGSRRRSPALLWGGLIAEGQSWRGGGAEWPWLCGKQALDLALRSLQTGFYIPRTRAPKGGKMALLGVWGHSWYPDPAQEVSYLFCQSFCSLFSSFELLKVKLLSNISQGKLCSQDQNHKQYNPSKKIILNTLLQSPLGV